MSLRRFLAAVFLAALMVAPPNLFAQSDADLLRPVAFEIIQKGNNGLADIPYECILPPDSESADVALYAKDGDQPTQRATRLTGNGRASGVFKDVAPGFYRLCATSHNFRDCRMVGVGTLFLVAGQSNVLSIPAGLEPPVSKTGMVSVNRRDERPPTDLLADPNLRAFVIPSQDDRLQANACWIVCGDLLAETTGEPVGFMNVAVSATSSDAWKPDGGCFPALEALLSERPFAAILWGQGESDVLGKLSETTSYQNMKDMIEASRAIRPDIPWIVALDSLKTDVPYDDLPVRRAQRRIIDEGLALQGPDLDQIREHKGWVGIADFGGGGIVRAGELWFESLASFLATTEKSE